MAIAGDSGRSRLDANRDRAVTENGHMPITVVNRSFGSVLRARRSEADISLRRLAFRSGLTPAAVSAIETEKVAAPNLITAWKLAATLGVSLGAMVEELEEEVPTR